MDEVIVRGSKGSPNQKRRQGRVPRAITTEKGRTRRKEEGGEAVRPKTRRGSNDEKGAMGIVITKRVIKDGRERGKDKRGQLRGTASRRNRRIHAWKVHRVGVVTAHGRLMQSMERGRTKKEPLEKRSRKLEGKKKGKFAWLPKKRNRKHHGHSPTPCRKWGRGVRSKQRRKKGKSKGVGGTRRKRGQKAEKIKYTTRLTLSLRTLEGDRSSVENQKDLRQKKEKREKRNTKQRGSRGRMKG